MAVAIGKVLQQASFFFTTGTLLVTDRKDLPGVECRVLDWGSIDLMLDGGEDHCEIRLSNGVINGRRFSDWWSLAAPPEGVIVIVLQSLAFGAPAFSPVFVGAISEITKITELEVTVELGDPGYAFFRDIGEPITRAEFPQAEASALDKIKPIILGPVRAYTPPLVRERKIAALTVDVTAAQSMPFNADVDSNDTWPISGSLVIDSEQFSYDNTGVTSKTVLKLTARAQNGTSAAAHDIGSQVEELAKPIWCVAGHTCASVDNVYAITQEGTLIALDTSQYGVHLGDVSDPRCTVNLLSEAGTKIAVPSKIPTFRRAEFSAAASTLGTPGVTDGIATGTAAKNPNMACGDAAEWQQNNFAVLNKTARDTLSIVRTSGFPDPGVAFERAYIGIEHYGLTDFGEQTKLTASISGVTTTIPVEDSTQFTNAKIILIDSELMLVTLIPSDNGINVTRGFAGTAILSHGQGTKVFEAVITPNTPVYPEVRVYLERAGGGVFDQIAVITDPSDIPPEVAEDNHGFTEGQSLTAFHGHAIDGGTMTAGFYLPAGYDFKTLQWSQIGGLVGASVRDFGSGQEKPAYAETLASQVVKGATIQAEGWAYVMSPASAGLPASVLQRMVAIRVRVVHAGIGGVGSIRLKFYLAGTLVINTVLSNTGAVAKNNPPDSDAAIADLSAYPNGVRLDRLYAADTYIHVSNVSGNNEIYFVGIDVAFDQQQLLGNSNDFVNDRVVLTGSFDLVIAGTSSSFDNGVAGVNSAIVLDLFDGSTHPYLGYDTSKNYEVRAPGGTADQIVFFTQTQVKTADVGSVLCLWTGIDAPSTARVRQVSVFMDVTYQPGATAGATVTLIDKAGPIYNPGSSSIGQVPNIDGTKWTRRCWRATWNLEALGITEIITVKKLINRFRAKIAANGSGSGGFFCHEISYAVETDSATSQVSQSLSAEQFTRMRYIDVTDKVASYADIANRRLVIALNNSTIRVADESKPFMVSRCFWAFRFKPLLSEEVRAIAVDVTGYALSDNLDAMRKVLNAGYPLLAVPPAGINLPSFTTAVAAGALKLGGVIDEQIPARELLNEMAEQARVSFLYEGGLATVLYKPDLGALPPIAYVFSFAAGDVLPDSLEISYRLKDDVSNFVSVRAGRDFVSESGWRVTAETFDSGSITKYGRRPLGIDARFLDSASDAANLACQQMNYRREREIVVRWISGPTTPGVNVKRGDRVQLVGPLSIPNADRLEVLGVRKVTGSLADGPPNYEITTVIRFDPVACALPTYPSLPLADGTDPGGGNPGSNFSNEFDGDFA